MENVQSKEQLFGVKAVASGKQPATIFNYLKNLVSFQPWKFWAFTYGLSIVLFYFLKTGNSIVDFFLIFNLIFFPFTAIILGRISLIGYPKVKLLQLLLYPSIKDNLALSSLLFKVITLGFKALVYFLAWIFSFLLGSLSLLIVLVDVKKISR